VRAWLHDGVLQLLEYIAAGGYAEAPDAGHLREVAAVAADELRAYVDGDRAGAPRDLSRALAEVVDDARLLAPGLTVRLAVDAAVTSAPASLAAPLAAAVGEALANVRKHARAARATVRAELLDGVLLVRVEDDGAGFDLGTTRLGSGLRLSVLGRLAALGGRADVDSAPGRGTRVTLAVRVHVPETPTDTGLVA
jgi:signal transduction histidine kinase